MGETTPSPTNSSNCSTNGNGNNSPPCSSHVLFRWSSANGCRKQLSTNNVDTEAIESFSSPSSSSSSSSSGDDGATRVHFTYQDEATRARICKNAQALVDGLQRDRESMTVNAQVARKALRYRRLMDRFSDLDPDSTSVDISAFLGIEWHRIEEQSSAGSPETSETSSSSLSSPNEDEKGADKSKSPTHAVVDL